MKKPLKIKPKAKVKEPVMEDPTEDMLDYHCDKKQCKTKNQCFNRSPKGYVCSRPFGHTGQHCACSSMKHNLSVWN